MTDSLDLIKKSFQVLKEIYNKGAYSNLILNETLKEDGSDGGKLTYLVYGVVEKDVQFEYYIGQLCEKRPKPDIAIILKIGLFLVLYYNAMGDYAAVSTVVELAKSVGKEGAAGFVNAVLRKCRSVQLPEKGTRAYLSVVYSYPEWIVGKLIKQYGSEFAEKFLSYERNPYIHIRPNLRAFSRHEFEKILIQSEFFASELGYYVRHNTMKKLNSLKMNHNVFAVQGLSSMIACKAVPDGASEILDACAAPGGKSVYLSELHRNAKITSCDIHDTRVRLIQGYAESFGADNISAVKADAAVFTPDFADRFDAVLCDVPCSGLGLTGSKPDILLNRRPEDITELAVLQSEILSNCAKYVRKGGILIYSTCTVLKEENENIVKAFLGINDSFMLCCPEFYVGKSYFNGEFVKLFPHTDGTDGFFVAAMRRLN